MTLPGFEHLLPAEPPKAATPGRGGPSAEQLTDGLNEPQAAAVTHAGAPLLVVAGAGSGKTRVLTRRIAWLISQRGAHPGSILAITFTNKAAAEMKERVADLVGNRAKIMWVSTFHSSCVRILRKEIGVMGYKSNFSIYDASDSKRLMTLVTRDLELDPRQYQPQAILNWVSNNKNELLSAEDMVGRAANAFEKAYARAYAEYQRRLLAANALDFDDLIMLTVQLLQQFPDIRENYRRRFRHVLVDEYQDTNHAQYQLIHQLCALQPGEPLDDPTRAAPSELMVVGDADQSIYAFRGANIRNILDFEKDFPQATSILLEQNYRSTQTILTAANAVIGNNSGRKPKRLWTASGDGEKIIGYVADNEHDEARFVSEQIDAWIDAGGKPGDVAVFYRTNAQSRVFEEVFIRTGQSYKVVGGVRFYERKEVRDALAYLRTLVNPSDEISLRRILNTPKRGIGDRAEACVQAFAERERISFFEALQRAEEAPGLATRSLNNIRAFVDMLTDLQQMVAADERPDVILQTVLDRSGMLAALEDSDDPQDDVRVENLAELVAVAREFADDPTPGPSADPAEVEAGTVEVGLGDFLERVALVADADQIPDHPDAEAQGTVTLMTLHTAKGLEFPVVFLTGMEDGVFPHQRTLGDSVELEEERRLAYVGLTRAEQKLHISRALVRSAWGAPSHNPESRFVAELPVDLVDWKRTAADQFSWNRPTAPGGAYGSGHSGGWNTGGSRAGGGGYGYSEEYAERDSGPAPKLGQLTAAGRRNFTAAAARSEASAKSKKGRAIPHLEAGDRVVHDTHGMGTVVALQGAGDKQVASVDFGSAGVKRLLLRYAPVEKL